MKAVLFLAAVSAASAMPDFQFLWTEWKARHNKSFTPTEDAARFENFKRNHAKIQELNSYGTATYGLNKFAAHSAAELKAMRGLRVTRELKESFPTFPRQALNLSADSVDWRSKGKVSPIQDQGQCGSCWAFSATSNMESVYAIKTGGSPPKLAEQFLVDCDHQCGTYRSESGCDQGCNGGLQPNAFKYVMAHGQPLESAYPYRAVDGTCKSGLPSAVKISNYAMVSEDEGQMATFLANTGPVSIAVDAEQWSFYTGGVMHANVCPKKTGYSDLDHGVNIVGYGTLNGADVWIIRNSWGTDWGNAGYAYVPRGTGFCGINLFACSATA